MHFLIVYMNKLDLIRFLPYPRKFFLSIFPVRCGRMRDHEDRGGPEAENLQQQFKNSEKSAFIFQIRNFMKTQQTFDFFGFLQSFRESSHLRFTKNLMRLE